MCLRKILMIVLVLPLIIIFDNTRDVFAAKISNCSNCSKKETPKEKYINDSGIIINFQNIYQKLFRHNMVMGHYSFHLLLEGRVQLHHFGP